MGVYMSSFDTINNVNELALIKIAYSLWCSLWWIFVCVLIGGHFFSASWSFAHGYKNKYRSWKLHMLPVLKYLFLLAERELSLFIPRILSSLCNNCKKIELHFSFLSPHFRQARGEDLCIYFFFFEEPLFFISSIHQNEFQRGLHINLTLQITTKY